MTTTDVPTTMNTTPPGGHEPFVGARVIAGLIDIAIVATAVAPLMIVDPGVALVVGFVLAAVYATIFEGGPAGQTVGKRLAGVRVIDTATGGSIGRGRALVRHLVRLPVMGVGLWLMMVMFPRNRTWYDWAVRAAVVPA